MVCIISVYCVDHAFRHVKKYIKLRTGCPQSFSLLDFDKYIVHSADNKDELISLIKQGQVDKIKCRFNVWRLCLGVLDFDSSW